MGRPPRRTLTPLSGELAAGDDPLPLPAEPEPRRRRRPPPTTKLGAILHGLRRFGIALAVASALILAVDALLGWFAEADSAKVLKLSFYVGGAFMAAAGAAVGSGSGRQAYYWSRSEREIEVSWSVVYVALGACLFAIGIALDIALG